MRLALLSYSHHGRGMAIAARTLGHTIVAVMDGEEGPRQRLADEFGCPGYATADQCLDAGLGAGQKGAGIEAVLVAGKHVEMPSHVQACVERGLPFLLDKPFADCAERLRPAAEAALQAGVPNALTLPNRVSRFVALVQQMREEGSLGDLILYNSRLNNGPPSRYDPTPSAWQNDASISGGGCWAVEAAHGIDTFLQFVEERPVVAVGALMSNTLYGREVEDIGLGILRTERGVTGIIESGYSYPSFPPNPAMEAGFGVSKGARSGDHFFRFIGTKASLFEHYDPQGQPIIEVHTTAGVTFQEDIPNSARFIGVMDAALHAVQEGRSFEANIATALQILEVQDQVYALARANALTNGPHPLGQPMGQPARNSREIGGKG